MLSAGVAPPSVAAGEEAENPVADGPAAGGDEVQVNTSVFYATNRGRDGGEASTGIFSGERGEPSFGRCRVEFTRIPIINQLGSMVPFYPGQRYAVWPDLLGQANYPPKPHSYPTLQHESKYQRFQCNQNESCWEEPATPDVDPAGLRKPI